MRIIGIMRNHYLHREPRDTHTSMAPPKRTFSIWIPRYLSSLQTKNYAENTIQAYGRTLRLFARYATYLKENEGVPPASCKELDDMSMGAEIETNSYEIGDFLQRWCTSAARTTLPALLESRMRRGQADDSPQQCRER